jgi:hypothetical protein
MYQNIINIIIIITFSSQFPVGITKRRSRLYNITIKLYTNKQESKIEVRNIKLEELIRQRERETEAEAEDAKSTFLIRTTHSIWFRTL